MSRELADLLFPDVKNDIFYYENLYPRRDLKKGAIVTRYAPSPTGFVHMGALFTSMVAKKIVDQTEGVFFLRIEDTDQERSIENGINLILKDLKDFNIKFDEGPIDEEKEIGNYGPYIQSKRGQIYLTFAKYLVEKGLAYPCFCTSEELKEMREEQEKRKLRPGYYSSWAKCRKLSLDEIKQKIENGDKWILRFRSPGSYNRKIKYKDLIKGEIEFPENDQDIVLIKSDGLPTYHFAHVIDDHLMRTNTVIRGDEWISSVPLHIQLFESLGFEVPNYAHIAPIMKEENGGKRKLSKRKDPEAAVSYFYEQGIPEDAVMEYLMTIANSNYEEWRKQNPQNKPDDFEFKLEKMNLSGALFDMVKLLDISKNLISTMTKDEVYEKTLNWSKLYDNRFAEILQKNPEYAKSIFNIEREGIKPRKDISKWSEVKNSIEYMYNELYNPSEYVFAKLSEKNEIINILNLYIEKYYNDNDEKDVWFNKIKDLSEELGYAREVKMFKKEPEKYKAHVGDVSTVLRVALTSRQNTPDMYQIMKILGKDEIENRFRKCISQINSLL